MIEAYRNKITPLTNNEKEILNRSTYNKFMIILFHDFSDVNYAVHHCTYLVKNKTKVLFDIFK